MKLEIQTDTLHVSGLERLGAQNANAFRASVDQAFSPNQKNIDIDLSETVFMDSCGLGALVSLRKSAANRQGNLRLLNPQPPIRQILELTRMDRILDIAKT
jgi:anti-sigma B factor antagonist